MMPSYSARRSRPAPVFPCLRRRRSLASIGADVAPGADIRYAAPDGSRSRSRRPEANFSVRIPSRPPLLECRDCDHLWEMHEPQALGISAKQLVVLVCAAQVLVQIGAFFWP